MAYQLPDDALPRRPDQFSRLQKPSADYQRSYDRSRLERSCLRWLMGHMKLSAYRRPMLAAREMACGAREYSFAAFNEFFPTFPFRLGSHTLKGLPVPWGLAPAKLTPDDYAVHKDKHSAEPSRFKKLEWVPFIVAYRMFCETLPSQEIRHPALVFPRKGFAHGMVVHDDETEVYWTGGLCWVYKDAASGSRLYVQPFSSLVKAIYNGGRGWRPGETSES